MNWRKWLLISIVVGYMGILIIAPLGAIVFGAFREGTAAMLTALQHPHVLRSFGLTLIICLVVVAIHGIFGTLVAWVLVRHQFVGKAFVNRLLDLPFAMSPVIVGFTLIVLFGRNGVLKPLTEAFDWQIAFALPGMILATLFVTLPFMVRELMPVLEAFGRKQEEAAATLGASGWQTFRLVTFPALRWAFLYGLGLTCARALGEFGAVLVISGGIQGRTETATVYIFRALDDRQYAGAYSAALLLGAISLVLVLVIDVFHRRSQKSIEHRCNGL